MKKIIVTGANGQLGQEIKQWENDHTGYQFAYTDIDSLDLSNTSALKEYLADQSPDILINCAAYTAVDKAETEPELSLKINAKVPTSLAKMSQELGFKLIHISTDYVFSGDFHYPIDEKAITNPKSVYGKTKLEGENMVLKHADAVIIRTSWLYSIFGDNFVKSMLHLGRERDELGVVYDQVGTPTNACDLAKAILTIVDRFAKENIWQKGIYHYSNEGVCSWYDFAREIMEQAQLDCEVKPILSHQYPVPAPRPNFSVLNKQKIKDTYNVEIPHWKNSLSKAIKKLK